MRTLIGLMAVIGGASAVQAQTTSKPIDTNALVVKPVDTTTGIIGGTARYISRVTADTLDNNALIRTVNKLFGTTKPAAPVQGGLSPLPAPNQYLSTYYKSPIQPTFPSYQVRNR